MAKKIMIQGTMSNAGKSFLCTGLLRIFASDGYRAAPFKAQNMALNSYITKDLLEIGRAQAVQAQAAGIEPCADMNPVLLKPTTDVGSQVIVRGVPVGNMSAEEYYTYKKELMPVVLDSFKKLDEAYDIIVIEGAGSPAEINLKDDDIVNMGLAKLVHSPVLLAGDIDPGGVFAQLYGTVMLLNKEERDLIKGLIINKFRGDLSILSPGIRMIEDLCDLPVIGVVPYTDVKIEDEDSLRSNFAISNPDGLVDIAVIRFPRISNYTDIDALTEVREASVRYVSTVSELGTPDLIILPGSKSTISDLLWMRENGLEAGIRNMAGNGVPVFGICGGYQMMGMTITDNDKSESDRETGTVCGMELIPTETVFHPEKVRTRVTGAFGTVTGALSGLSGMNMSGYEIHMGLTSLQEGRLPLCYVIEDTTGEKSGLFAKDGISDGNCYGTYLHGIFDEPGIAEAVVNSLLKAKGISDVTAHSTDHRKFKESQFDELADVLREHLDIGKIYKIMEDAV